MQGNKGKTRNLKQEQLSHETDQVDIISSDTIIIQIIILDEINR